MPSAPRAAPLWRQLALMAATAAWQMLTRPFTNWWQMTPPPRPLTCPLLTGKPPGHPEPLRRHLCRRQDCLLAQPDRAAWAEGECAGITKTWRLS